MRLFRLLTVVALVLTCARQYAASPVAAKDEIATDAVRVECIRVIDGVAVNVVFNLSRFDDPDQIRMIGIDTSETTYTYGNHPEYYGEEASKKIDCLLVAASAIWVEIEPKCLLCVAGHLSEAHACGLVDPREASEVAWTAEEQFGNSPDDRRTYVEAPETKALAMLLEKWSTVERVAQLLVELATSLYVEQAPLRSALAGPAR